MRTELAMTNPATEDLNPYHAKVIRFIAPDGEPVTEVENSPYSLLISAGRDDGISANQRVMIFELGEEIVDPDTGLSLGRFEIVKGEGRVTSAQSKMSVVYSERTKMERKTSQYNALLGLSRDSSASDYIKVTAPFRNAKIGDLVRFI
jgi:hypothetical protein